VILICGGLADLVTEFVCARIENLGYEYRLLNLGLYPARYRVSCTWDEGELYGSILPVTIGNSISRMYQGYLCVTSTRNAMSVSLCFQPQCNCQLSENVKPA